MADNTIRLENDFKPIRDSIDKLISSLGNLEKRLESVQKDVSIFDRLFGNTEQFNKFVQSVNQLQKVSTDAFGSLARGLSQIGTAFKNFPSDFNIGNFNLFTESVLTFFQKLQGLNINLGREQIASIGALSKALTAIASVSSVDLSSISISQESINSIALLVNTLAGLPSNANQKVGILDQLFGAVKGIFDTKIGTPGAQNLSLVSDSLLSFSRAIKNINNNIQDVDVQKTVNVFGQLAGSLQIISFVLSKLPGSGQVEEFSKTFQRLGIGLSGIARGVESLDTDSVVKLVKALTLLGGAIKIISSLTRFGGDKNALAFSQILGSVIGALGDLNKISSFKNQNQLAVSLGDQLKFIGNLFTTFRKLKGAKIPDISTNLKAVVEAFKVLSEGVNIDLKSVEKFEKFIDRIAKSLLRLNSIRVDTAKAVAIGQQVEALTKLSNIEQKLSSLNKALTFGVFLQALPNIINGIKSIADAIANLPNVVSQALIDSGQQLNQFGDTLINRGKQLLNAFSLESLTQSTGFNIAADFEKLSKQLEVFGGLLPDQVKSAQAFADTIGIKYPLSANEALKATLDLLKAGQDLNDVFEILPSAADLAALSDTGSIELTTRALIAAESAFAEFSDGVEGSFNNVSKAADILSAGADVSTASIEDINEGLSDVAATANTAGLTLEETTAALAILNDGQLRASEGGRGLRQVLNSIFSRDKAAEEFKKLGVAVFDTAGNIRSFDDILKDLRKRFDGFTQQQIVDSLGNIADTFGRTALSILITKNGLSDTIEEMRTLGTAFDKAQLAMDNFRGDAEQLRGSLETLLKDVFLPLVERAFRPFVQGLRQVIDFLIKLPAPVKEAASAFLFLASSIATLLGGAAVAIGVLSKLSGAILIIAGHTVGLLFNIQRLAIVIAGFATSLLVVLPTLVALGGALAVFSEALASAFRMVEDNVGGAGKAFERLKKTVEEIFGEVVRIITTAGQAIQVVFREFFGQSDTQRGSALANTFNTITGALSNLLDTLKNIDTTALISFFARLRIALEGFVESVTGVFNRVSKAVGDFFAPIRTTFNDLIVEVSRFIKNFTDVFSSVGNEVKDFPIVDTIVSIVKFIQSVIVGQIANVTNILRALNTILEPLITNIPIFIDDLKRFVGVVLDIFQPLIDFIVNQASIVIKFFQALPDLLVNLPNAGEIVKKFASDFINGLLDLPRAIGSVIERIGLTLGSRLVFFLGQGLVTGDLRPFINGLIGTIQDFLLSVPTFFIQLGKDVGNEFITNFGIALKQGDILPAVNAFLDLVGNLLLQGIQRVVQFISSTIGSLIASIFSSAGEEVKSFNVIDFVQGIIDFITAPLRFAILGLARGLDFTGVAAEIAATFVRNLVRAVVSLIPSTLTVIASALGDGLIKSALLGMADGIRILVNALSGLLAFPLSVLGSVLNFFSVFLDTLEKIGITRGTTLLVITSLTLALTGLGNAIVTFARQITINLVQPAIIALQSLLFQVRSFAGQILFQARTAILQFVSSVKTAFNAAFTASIQAGAQVLARGFTGLAGSVVNLGRAGFAGIITGLKGIASGIRGLIQAAAPLLTTISLVTTLKGALDALAGSAEGLPFLRTFIQSVGDSLLSLVGLDQLIPRFHEGLDILQGIFEAFVQIIGDKITQLFLNILNGFNDLRARIEKAIEDLGGPQSAFAKQFFEIGDLLRDAGEKSGIEFFNGLINNMIQGDPEALRAQLLPFRDVVLNQFQSMLSEAGNFLGPLEDQTRIANFLAFSDLLPQAFRIMEDNTQQLMSFFFTSLTEEQQSESFAPFFESLIRSGVENIDLNPDFLRDRIVAELEAGTITNDQARKFLESLGFTSDAFAAAAGELQGRFEVLTQSTSELFAVVQQSNMDDLKKQFEEGKISADEYQAALNKLGDEIVSTIDKIREDKIAALTKQFDEGAISEAEFREQFQALNKEADETTIAALNTEIERIATAAQEGAIPLEDAAKQISALKDRLNELSPATGKVGELQAALDKLAQDFLTKSISAAKFAEEFQRISAAIEEAKKSAGETPSGSTGGGLAGLFQKIFDNANRAPDTAGQEELNQQLEEELKIREKIADFNRNEARKLEDDLREEQEKRDDIEKIRQDAAEKEADDLQDFLRDRERAEQDHQNKLLEIARSANDQFNDAIAGRDSSAAQAAQKQLQEQTRQENDQFKLEERRAQEDFELNRQRAQRERDERILEAQQSLQDLIDKNARERARRLEDHNIELAELQAKNTEILATQKSADDAQLVQEKTHQSNMQQAFVNGVAAIENAVAQGLPGIAGLFVTTLTNLYNQLAQTFNQPTYTPMNAQQQPTGTPHGRGGPVSQGKQYQIKDTAFPEIYQDDKGRTYFLPGRSGYIKPLQPNRAGAGAAGGGINVNLSFGDFNINGAGGDANSIAQQIKDVIARDLTKELKDQLAGRRKL